MRNLPVLLLVLVGCMSESHSGNRNARAKRELLLRSKRRWVLSTIELTEEDRGPYPKIISRMYNDKKDKSTKNQKYVISGMGVNKEPRGVFSIDENTGHVYAHGPVDREQYALFPIKFDIVDKVTGLTADDELSFDVEIMDINDNPPTFANSRIKEKVKENSEEGYLSLQLQATDRDQRGTPNSNVTMSVISQKPQQPVIGLKQIDDRLAQLTLTGCFNYDKVTSYVVIVQAKDHGTPSLSSTAVITLDIVDSNTHPPVFKEAKYQGEVFESTIKRDILRVAVEDKDTPNTPGWRAKYFFIKGNEDGSFQIETDPETNEGILSVIKKKDFEKTSFAKLQIGVENEEPLFICKDNSIGAVKAPPPATVDVNVKVIDFNDPPEFKEKTTHVYQREEEEPGKLLFTPEVHDVDSDVKNIRYVLLHEPAKWLEIDRQTGQVKTIKKMDRESPFVEDSIYNITIGAEDDGEPPATGTCTLLVHLTDINDNTPQLVNKRVVMCGNKVNKVMVAARDSDDRPYSGPFIFSLRDNDGTVKRRWKLDPPVGEEGGLVSLKTLPYGNYTVPLTIQDQQSVGGNSTLEVTVCDCGGASVCRGKVPLSTSGGAACIGVIFAGLLLFLLLLLIVMCQCGEKAFNHGPIKLDEGNQTLIKYNQEGGGSECMTKPVLPSTPTNAVAVTEGLKKAARQVSETDAGAIVKKDVLHSLTQLNNTLSNSSMGAYQRDSDFRGAGRRNRYYSWSTNKSNSMQQGRPTQYQRSFSLQSQQHIIDHIDKKLHMMDGGHVNYPSYRPYEYAYEGEGSKSNSLDKLSLGNLGDDLQFLNDLEPKFKTLGNICHRAIQEKERAALKNTTGV